MKKNIHPKYNNNIKVSCSCGNVFVTGSILEEINTELCSNCHPFYTGEQKIVDTANLVSKFEERQKKAGGMSFKSKREKMASRKEKINSSAKSTGTLTLKDMLANITK